MYCNSMKFTAFSLTLYQLSYQDSLDRGKCLNPCFNTKNKIVALEQNVSVFPHTWFAFISLGSFGVVSPMFYVNQSQTMKSSLLTSL